MAVIDLVFLCLVMLLGEEGKDYQNWEHMNEEWQRLSWVHRN